MPIHPGYLRAGMTVIDLTAGTRGTKFVREATLRGCAVVHPGTLLIEHARAHVARATGQDVPFEVLAERLAEWAPADDEG